ncbi:MAG: hypothetical protein ACLQQM_12420 [Acidimicrobiales bacterium]
MPGQVVQVAWYGFWATFGRRWGGYLSIVLLIGLAGGIGMGSLAAARRTQSSFSTFLASTNPSDMNLNGVYGPNLTKELAHLPGVERAEAAMGLTAFPLGRTGAPIIDPAFLSGEASTLGSINGEYFDQDRVTVTQGRMADPRRADEFVTTAQAEQLLGWQVGEVFPMGFYTAEQSELPAFGTAKVKPRLRLDMTLVGTVMFNNEVVLDEVDRYPAFALFTPALTGTFATGDQVHAIRTQAPGWRERGLGCQARDHRGSPEAHHVLVPCHLDSRGTGEPHREARSDRPRRVRRHRLARHAVDRVADDRPPAPS